MKKFILLLIIFFGLYPIIKNSSIEIAGPEKGYCQNTAYILQAYLQQTQPGPIYKVSSHGCGCGVEKIVNGVVVDIIYATPDFIYLNPSFQTFMNNNSGTLPPPPSSNPDPQEQIYSENYISHLWDIARTEARMQSFADWASEFWSNLGSAGQEPASSGGPSCIEEPNSTGAARPDEWGFNHTVNTGTTNCENSFLLRNLRVIHFPQNMLDKIASFNFDGSTLVSVTGKDGFVYKNVLIVELYQNNRKCPPNYDHYETSPWYEMGIYSSYKFVAMDKVLRDKNNGTLNVEYDTRNSCWIGINYSDLNYCFDVPDVNAVAATAGTVVMGVTTSGVKYCETLTSEDCALTTTRKRNDKYKLPLLQLDHYLNLPKWVFDFLEKFSLPPDDCTVAYVNQRLGELHATPSYANEPLQNIKKAMEYRAVAYHMLFGVLYCKTNESAATGKSSTVQFGMGMLHEAIASVDVLQISDGLAKLGKGLVNLVAANVKNVLDAAQTAVVQNTTSGIFSHEEFAKKLIASNNAQYASIYSKAVTIASHFKDTYFSKCNLDPQFGNICSYRHGQVLTMALPVILTGGDWLVLKAGTLVTRYAAKTARAIELMDAATAAGKNVLVESYTVYDDLGAASSRKKTVIKETNGTITTTIKKQEDELGVAEIVISQAPLVIDNTKLIALTPEIPTSSGYLNKKKFESAEKIDPDIDVLLKTQADDIIANSDVTGSKTEVIQDYLFETKLGLTRLDAKYNGNNGLDGLYIEGTVDNPTRIVITECKQQWSAGISLSGANPATGLPLQMSDNWIQYIADKLENAGKVEIADMLRLNTSLIEKFVVTVNKSTRDINILKLNNY